MAGEFHLPTVEQTLNSLLGTTRGKVQQSIQYCLSQLATKPKRKAPKDVGAGVDEKGNPVDSERSEVKRSKHAKARGNGTGAGKVAGKLRAAMKKTASKASKYLHCNRLLTWFILLLISCRL